MWAMTATAAGRVRQARTLDMQQGIRHLDDGAKTVLAADALAARLPEPAAG